MLDAGFNILHPAFAAVTVVARRDFVFNDSVVHDEPGDVPGAQFHGTAVWSLLAADVPGRLRGVAPAATYLLAKTEDIRSETPLEEDNYVAALEWADSIGVDIVSSSLAYLIFDPPFPSYGPTDLTGDIAVTTIAVDRAAERGILVVTAAGNTGPGARTIWTPADADSAIAVGAEDSLGTIASFSSRGPTADGRLKPDLTAPGVDVCALAGSGVRRLAGTSFATPLIAATAALIRQVHPALDPIGLAEALRRSGSNHRSPDAISGWGRPDGAAAAVFPLGVTPLEPVDSVLTSVTPVFRWTVGTVPAFARPVQFRLRVALDSTLGALVFDSSLIDVEQYASSIVFKPSVRLFWRVDGRAASGETATTGTIGVA
ncbi:MAG: S8 family serine peptidase, partial [Acidimicrobiales bacterium]